LLLVDRNKFMAQRFSLILVLAFIFFNTCFSQNGNKSRRIPYLKSSTNPREFLSVKDTVFSKKDSIVIMKNMLIVDRDSLLKKNELFYLNNDTVFVQKDTVVSIRDTIIISQDTFYVKYTKVFEDIWRYTQQDRFFPKLLRKVFVFDDKFIPSQQNDTVKPSEEKYEEYEKRIIRNIDIKVLDPFGPSVTNTSRKARHSLGMVGNFFHINTQRAIIRNKLLFKKNEIADPLKFAESERLLRDGENIYDAKIIVYPSENNDSVDVLVIVQDVWSISGSGAANSDFSVFKTTVRDVNFFGVGHKLEVSVQLDKTLPRGYNYGATYNINNIYKTFSSAFLYHRFENGVILNGIGINRDFITPSIKLGGGANYYGTNMTLINTSFAQQDYWIGHSFKLSHQQKDNNRLIVATRYLRTRYSSRPERDTIPYYYNNSDFYLASAGYLSRSFYKDNHIFRLGKTEDIATGRLIALTFGKDFNEAGDRYYWGINTIFGKYEPGIGYSYVNINLGSYRNNGRWEEGVISTKLLYFSPLLYIDRWKFRNFVGVRYMQEINQRPDLLIDINRENGLRGLRSELLKGTERFVVNYEANFFPPVNFFGFKTAMMAFSDLGWISSKGILIHSKNFYPGFGVGLKFQNEHLVFSMIQLIFAYYPNAHRLNANEFFLFERTKYFFNFNNFDYYRPSVVSYN
jgi:hypothetical protein